LVKVTFKPWEEVIIHESVRYSLEDLVKIFSIGVGPGGRTQPLLWAKGVVFSYVIMAPTANEVVEEQLDGKVHWLSTQWALMPEYKKEILIQEINAKIPVADVSANSLLCAVAEALKK